MSYRLSFAFGHVRYQRGDTWEDAVLDAVYSAENCQCSVSILNDKLHVLAVVRSDGSINDMREVIP